MNHLPGRTLARILILVLALGTQARAQEESAQTPAEGSGSSETVAGPGQQAEPQMGEIPPISSNEDSSSVVASELAPTTRSLLSAGVTLNQSVEIAPSNNSSNSYDDYSLTSVFGTVRLQKIIRRFRTDVDYKAGERFFRNSNGRPSSKGVQQLNAIETISGRKTSVTVEDLLAVHPGGNFGAQAFGGTGAYNLGLGGGTTGSSGTFDFFGFNQFGGLGQGSNISNVALVQLNQYVTPRSSVGVGGSYGITSYLGNVNLIDSQSGSGQVSYTYQLSPRSGISLSYGLRRWQYSGGTTGLTGQYTTANTLQFGYTRQMSSRLTVGFGVGPSIIDIHSKSTSESGKSSSTTITDRQTDASAYASIGYSFRTALVALSYDHLATGGSGFYTGSNSDIVQFSVSRPLLRVWAASADAGFVRLSNIGNNATGVFGNTYQYDFAGLGIQRAFGKNFSFTASYQINNERLACSASSACPGLSQQHSAVIGLSWRTLPIRID